MGFRARKPSLLIDGVQYQCKSNTMPDWSSDETKGTFCGPEYSIKVPIFLDYGVTGSYTTLSAIENTIVTCVFKPDDSAVSVDNPSWTFDARIPFIPPMTSAGIGERMTFDLELVAEDVPVKATA